MPIQGMKDNLQAVLSCQKIVIQSSHFPLTQHVNRPLLTAARQLPFSIIKLKMKIQNSLMYTKVTKLYFFNLQQHLQTRLIHREPRSDREEFQTLLHLDRMKV